MHFRELHFRTNWLDLQEASSRLTQYKGGGNYFVRRMSKIARNHRFGFVGPGEISCTTFKLGEIRNAE